MDTPPRSLVDHFVASVGLSRQAFAAVVVLVLALLFAIAAFSRGGLVILGPRGLWQLGLEPTLIVYILLIYPRLQGRFARVIDALRPLASEPHLIDAVYAANRRGQGIALLLGAAFALWVTSFWRVEGLWMRVYLITANIVLFGLMTLAIHDGLARSRRLARVVGGLQLDLFDRQLLAPMARWGQVVSLTFVGGICLSLIFQSYETLHSIRSLVIYSILIVVALTLSVTSVWSIHRALVAAQQRELAVVRQHWAQARSEMKRKLDAEGAPHDAAELYRPMVVLGAYESQVLAASTWPFDPKVVKEVLASLVAPFLIYGLKIAIGRFSGGSP